MHSDAGPAIALSLNDDGAVAVADDAMNGGKPHQAPTCAGPS